MLSFANSNYSRAMILVASSALLLASACTSDHAPSHTSDPGRTVKAPRLPAEQQAELDQLTREINESANMTSDEFQALYRVPFTQGLSYDPTTAAGLPLIQASPFAIGAAGMTALGKNGFVITEKKRFPTFTYGYASIYAQDLPLFVSADSILNAVHRSYDSILENIEVLSLQPELGTMLHEMRDALAGGGAAMLSAASRTDTDVFLTVALSLLEGQTLGPVAGGDPSVVAAMVSGAQAASGAGTVTLFGTDRDIDFSQFKPRGHYTDSDELGRYFRTMMWLGRIDFRILETQPDGTQVFRRRQLEGALTLRQLMNEATSARWTRIDGAIQAFVGEPDYMTIPELASLLHDLNAASPEALADVSDARIVSAIVAGGYGTQRISSDIMIHGTAGATLPLSSSFALFGQRYVVDSHVFSNVVYDRVQKGTVLRMMPDPLDAAFAAFGNDQAGALLAPGLTKWHYAPDLHAMRLLVDAHPEDFWHENLYNQWLTSLRDLSPSAAWAADADTSGLPAVATTEAWGRRLLNTQLASWAELRHDTILYAKQSYTGGSACEFPDAYIDPYPKFYQDIASFATKGAAVASTLDLSAEPSLSGRITAYFTRLHDTALTLEAMAEQERTGAPFTADQMVFINQAVVIQYGCGDAEGATGWYPDLFWSAEQSVTYDPTIADVHTQPTDEAGNQVGRILHVGTGMPRLMVVTVDTCTGPRAYVGLASSYFERVTENFERLEDKTWASDLNAATPDDVPWMQDLVVR